jgi:hypothetical protein
MSANKNGFLQRADAHIALANEQLNESVTQGEVSASFSYGAARYNAWMASTSVETVEDLINGKDEIVEYFLKEYKLALEEHMKNHIDTFGTY